MRPIAIFVTVFVIGCASGEDSRDGSPGSDVKTSDLPAVVDAPADQYVKTDSGGVDAPVKLDSGTVPLVMITEFIPNPAAVNDTEGEWLELYNTASFAVDLGGWKLKDDGSNSHTIQGSLVIGAGQYLVLGNNDQVSTNGGVAVDYKYTSYTLANSEDEIVLVSASGVEVDRVAYTSSWGISPGASMQLKSTGLDNNVAANWCVSTTPWTGSTGDMGTPGGVNVCLQLDGGVPDAAIPDAAVPDAAAPDAASPDAGVPDAWPPPPTCPPPGSSFSNPPTGLGDLDGQPCDYACWGSGTIYNQCAPNYWQYCLPQGVFAPCQPMP
jgi:hypothetical protein